MLNPLPSSSSSSLRGVDTSGSISQTTVIDPFHHPSLNNISNTIKYHHSQSQSVSHSKAILIPSPKLKSDSFALDSEIQALRQGISRVEGDRSLLKDYAAELRSRIRILEQERMDTQLAAKNNKALSPSTSRLPTKALSTLKPPIPLTRLPSDSLPSKQPSRSTSLSSSTSKQILSPLPIRDEQPISGTKSKLLPKRIVRNAKDSEAGKPPNTLHRPMSPSRITSISASNLKNTEKNVEKTSDIQPNKSSNVSKLPAPGSRSNKRTLFSSKLDSLVLTSKLLPVSSPRIKTSAKPPDPSAASILPIGPKTISNVSRNGDAVILDSPPSKGTIRPRHIIKIKQELPGSFSRAKNIPAENGTTDGKKTSLHVSFSNSADEVIDRKPDGPTNKTPSVESTSKLWGSWNKKRPSLQVPTIHEDPDMSSSNPSIHSIADDVKRKEKHRSLAPQYLRSLMSSSNESMSGTSHATLRRTNSMSACPTTSRPPGSSNLLSDPATLNSSKKRLSPLLVGSPTLPKARLESETEVDRVNSLGCSGKWANRSRIPSVDLTRRRTIHPVHPLFTFERPGSAGAVSTRDDKSGIVEDVELYDVKKQRRATMPAKTTEDPVPGSTPNQTSGNGSARLDPSPPVQKAPLLRPLLGGQTLGRFDFEASTSTSILPRRAERSSRLPTSLTKMSSSTSRLSKLGLSGSCDALASTDPESYDEKKLHEYIEFCKDLRAMLGDDDWSSFMNYARRFDLHILTPDVLLQRVKKLIDGRRHVDLAKRDKIYERFSKIVHDSIRD